MKVGLFIPCYIDQRCAKVASAMLKLLKKLSLEVHFPTKQNFCCCPKRQKFNDIYFSRTCLTDL
jgi:Fe-S oxidoreductase